MKRRTQAPDRTKRSCSLALVAAVIGSAGAAHGQAGPRPPTQTKPAVRPAVRTPPGAPAPASPGAPAMPGAAPTPAAPAPSGSPASLDAEDERLYRCKKSSPRSKTTVTLKPETEVRDLVQWAMGFTCRNFIYGSGIATRSTKVTIMTPSEISYAEAWRIFLVALQTMNLTVVKKGEALEIIEAQSARESPIGVYKGRGTPNTDQIVRAIIRPENISVEDLRGTFEALKSKIGVVTAVPSAGVLIVTDTGNSIDKMLDVTREIDQPGGAEKIYMVKLKYADANEVAQKLIEIFGQGKGGGGVSPAVPRPATPRTAKAATTGPTTPSPPVSAGGAPQAVDIPGSATPSKILPDERSNSIIVVASERAYAQILAVIRRLDVELGETGEGSVHVYPLENAIAEEMAGTLNQLLSGQGTTRPPSAGGRPGQGGAPAPAPTPAPAAGGGGSIGGTAFEGQVKITHDKGTNSLVVISSIQDFLALREVIRKLDIPRRQVFVEAAILEVSLDKTRQLGMSFHGGAPVTLGGEDSIVYGGVAHSNLNSLLLNPSSLLGLFGGLRGPELEGSQEILGISVPAFGVAFQLLQNNNDVNVLSSPHLLTTDNEPAEMSVGENIPYQGAVSGLGGFPTGTSGQPTGAPGGFGFPFQSIQRQDVALKLKITPHVNDSDFVRLELELEISDIASRNFENLGPSWTKRTVKNIITVKDQQPVVIGGLMQDKIILTESKVPLLGDIPILGYLFKYSTKQKTKRNLLIFLTPHIIHDQGDVERIFEKKMQERREFIEAFTSFSAAEFKLDVDYGKKRGLLEEINRRVATIDEEERIRQEATAGSASFDEGPIEMPPDYRGSSGAGAPPPSGPTPPSPPQIPPEQ